MNKIGYIVIMFIFSVFLNNICFANKYQNIIISSNDYAYIRFRSTIENKYDIIKYNINTRTIDNLKLIYDNKNCYIIDSASLNRQGDKLAVVFMCKSAIEGDNYRAYILKIYNSINGKEIISFNNGHSFSFSPNDEKIAFSEDIFGERGSKAPPDYNGGIWIYDFNNKTKINILKRRINNIDINWSEHDGNIYYELNGEINRYYINSNVNEKTCYRGMYFTADGKYNISISNEDGHKIYRTSDNKENEKYNTKINIESKSKKNIRIRYWSNQFNVVVVATGSDWQNVINDMDTGVIKGEFLGFVIGANPDGSIVAVEPIIKSEKGMKYDRENIEFINLKNYIK